MSAQKSAASLPWRWLEERYRVSEILAFARHKQVPIGAHSSVWYYLGGLSLFFFLMQCASGLLILMYYRVGPETSHESMKFLVTKVPFGWLIRSAHCWASHLMIACVIAHMFSVFFAKAYRKPRELTWMTGMALLGITLGFGFSGYLLPWNELSYFATAVGTESVKSVPLIGNWLLEVMRGGPEVTGATLYRFLAIHVSLLPLVGFALVGFHLALIQRQGMAMPLPHVVGGAPPRTIGMPFFPSFAMRDLFVWVIALNVVALLAVYFPNGAAIPGLEWELGNIADPLAPAAPGIKPEWYFLWMFQLLRETPPHVMGLEGPQFCMAFASLLGGIWVLVPFLDRRAARGEPSPAFTDYGVGAVLFLLYLTLLAWDLDRMLCAGLTIGLGLVITVGRLLIARRGRFEFTIAALLIPLMDGVFGTGYPLAITVATVLAIAATLFHIVAGRKQDRLRSASFKAALAVLLVAGLASSAIAEEPFKPNRELADLIKESTASTVEHLNLQPHGILERFNVAAEEGLLSNVEQFANILALGLMPQGLDLVLSDNCILCHTNPDLADDNILFKLHRSPDDPYKHLDLSNLESDVHFRQGLSCSGCHGGHPTDFEMSEAITLRWPNGEGRARDSSWIPAFCGNCHADPALMRRYNPALPVDQLIKYRESRHGQALLREEAPNQAAAHCVSCHGVHGIRHPKDPESLTNPLKIAITCAKCHSDSEIMKGSVSSSTGLPLAVGQFDEWSRSVHGIARMERGDTGAPACNNCHGNHAALPPSVATSTSVCRTCHVANAELFDGSPHKAAFDKNGWGECTTCHSNHEVTRTSDDYMKPGHPTNKCERCHVEQNQPQCNETAKHFHDSIQELVVARDQVIANLDQADHLGMDTEDLRFELADLDDAIKTTRSRIHSFDRTQVDLFVERGKETADRLDLASSGRVSEFAFRRRGFLVSTLLVTLFAILLGFKIKQVDRAVGFTGRQRAE